MNMKEPEDWVGVRDWLGALFMRVLSQYHIDVHKNPETVKERREYHALGRSALTQMTFLEKLIERFDVRCKDVESTGPGDSLYWIRNAINADSSRAAKAAAVSLAADYPEHEKDSGDEDAAEEEGETGYGRAGQPV